MGSCADVAMPVRSGCRNSYCVNALVGPRVLDGGAGGGLFRRQNPREALRSPPAVAETSTLPDTIWPLDAGFGERTTDPIAGADDTTFRVPPEKTKT